MKKFTCMSLCILLCAGLLAGCGTSVSSEQDLVYVDKKGGVVSVDVESLDAAYYSEEELKDFINEEIESYTQEHGKGTVSLDELKVEDGKAKLTMKYKTTEDYTEFNGIELYQGKIVKALAAGYDFKADFSKVEEGKVTGSATTKEIYATEDLKVVIIKANTDVQVPGDICYISNENVKLTGNNSVSIRAEYGSGAAENEAVNDTETPADDTVSANDDVSFETDVYTYIIYK